MSDDLPVASTADALWSMRLRQRESWEQGENVSVETLVAALDSRPLADEALLELILSEFQLREELGQRPSPDEYVRRFPHLQQRLERLFAVRAAMDNTESGQAAEQPTDSESPLKEASRAAPGGPSSGVATESVDVRMLGSYRLLEKIGEGGMGAVYKARHQKLKKVVSIKLLPQHLTSDAALTARFQREMESVGALDHPHIVRAMDAGEVDGTHFLVMEFVDGDDLAKIVKTTGPLSVEEACVVIQQAADALQHAHDHGLVHRDIKPSNLMWTRDKKVKVLDLGLARCQLEAQLAVESELTESGQALGTIDYMPPEQARDSKGVDGRADIYSLGCTLFFLLTGQPLYAGRGRVEKLFAHRDEPAPSLVAKRGDVPAELDRVYQRMVAKRPEDRYASMAEVLRALEAVCFQRVAERLPQTKTTANVAHSGTHPATALLEANSGDGHSATDSTIISELPLPPSAPPRPRSWLWMAGVVSMAALLAAVIFTLKTPDGTIIIEINEPDARVEVLSDKNQIEVTRQSDTKPITISLDPGKHRLKVSKDGFELYTEEFTIESKGTKTIGAKLVPISVTKSGWHGWPADAPPPAIAPFNAEQAKQHQEAWAKYLGVPVEYTNTIGMKFRLIPPGEFMMGSTPDEIEKVLKVTGDDKHWQECIKSEAPQHKVLLTQPFFLGIHEVTQNDYEKVIGKNPSYFAKTGTEKHLVEKVVGLDTSNHPVEGVSWNDATEFCSKLSEREKLKPGYFRLSETAIQLDGTAYRLPTEAQWEFACRAGTVTNYWNGDKDGDLIKVAWFDVNSDNRTHAVGELKANALGLYDTHGNVWEWVQDGWDPGYMLHDGHSQGEPEVDPQNGASFSDSRRVFRGGFWFGTASHCRASDRHAFDPSYRHDSVGFRVSVSVNSVKDAIADSKSNRSSQSNAWYRWPADAPKPAIAPFAADQAKKHQEEWSAYLKVPVEYTNSIGMKFRLIPPGEFMMGSTEKEITESLAAVGEHEDMKEWRIAIRSEEPRHRVVLDVPFYLGDSEVTQKDFLTVTGRNPAQISPDGKYKERFPGGDPLQQPVESVSWIDAVNFCSQLSDREQLKQESIMSGAYHLPTEAQWEFSCRAGTTSQFSSGNDGEKLSKVAWFWDSSGNCIHPVRKLDSNPFGIFDMHGNVEEWVFDTWTPNSYRATHGANMPHDSQQSAGLPKVIRGGHWFGNATSCRSANRFFGNPKRVHLNLGFRASLSIDAVRQKLKVSGPTLPNPISPSSQDRNVAQIAVRLNGEVAFVNAKGDQTARQLSELPSGPFTVKALQLAQSLVTDDDLKLIGELKDLQELILGECSQVTDAGLKNLGNLNSLSALNLLGTQVTDDGVAYLDNLPMLRRLILRKSQVTRRSLNSILRHRHLQELGLGKINVDDDDIVKLLPLESITDLDLHGTAVTDRVVDVLIRFPKLRSVSLGETSVTDEGMKKLLATPHVRRQLWRLSLEGNRHVTDATCGFLIECRALEGLWLESTRITDNGLQSLAKVPDLKEVWLQGTRVTPTAITNFKKNHPNCVVGAPIAE